MTRFLDAALRLGFGVLVACAGLAAPGSPAAASADAPRAPEIVRAPEAAAMTPSAPAALALVRAGFMRFDGRRSVPFAAAAPLRAAPSFVFSSVKAAPAAARFPGAAPGVLSRGPPASA